MICNIGAVISMDKMTLSIHIMIMSFIETGILVPIIQGIEAEKNNISDTLTMATRNLVMIGVSVTINAGRNISAMLRAIALADNSGSGTLVIRVNG